MISHQFTDHFINVIYTNLICFSLPDPPQLVDALAYNDRFDIDAEKIFANEILGAESMAIDDRNGIVYASVQCGDILAIDMDRLIIIQRYRLYNATTTTICDRSFNSFVICGRPLGLRFRKNHRFRNRLIIADAYFGIFELNVENGNIS